MPIDLNTHTVDSLTERVKRMKPGQSIISNDGQTIRRRQNSSGYECGVGRGGFGARRKNTPQEAAEDMMSASARHRHEQALGGATSHATIQEALDSLREDPKARPGPSPAVQALRAITRNTRISSYKTRAQRAREALAKGDIARAVLNLEAIAEHAANYGRLEDIDRARAAISAVREHHELDQSLAREELLRSTKIELRVVGSNHHVFRDGKDVTGPLSRDQAERRRDFLVRKATTQEGVQEIQNEIDGIPNVVRHADESQSAA